ncbi:MAG: hypothetical protein V1743_02120 [Nanoarchaeota archaeon]
MKRELKLHLLLLVIIITATALALAGCARKEPLLQPDEQTIDRLSRIPAAAIKITPETDAYPPVLDAEDWENPVPLSDAINTAGAEDSPFITLDGDTLYFFFTPDPNIPAEKQLFDGVTGIWVSKKVNGSWEKAERVILQDKKKLALDGCAFVMGNVMWFCSAREGYTGVNLFTAEFKDGKWKDATYAGDILKNLEVGEMHILNGTMYFHSARPGGKGGLDIWETHLLEGDYTDPVNIAAANTADNEGWPFVSQDGNELWFLRTYKGTPGIFRSIKKDGEWQEPQLIISQFAGEPSLDNAGNIYFVHHYYKDGKMLEADIYVAMKKPK